MLQLGSRFRLLLSAAVTTSLFTTVVSTPITARAKGPKEYPEYGMDFNNELKWLRSAFLISGFDTKVPDDARTLSYGPTSYTLQGNEAPWAGNYYPMLHGGVANRWQTGIKSDYDILSWDQVALLAPEELRLLSPAEKWDLFKGYTDFRTTQFERKERGPFSGDSKMQKATRREMWEGFCNGIRGAGLNAPEPVRSITVMSPQGIAITFEPSDIKALLGASYFYTHPKRFNAIGERSFKDDKKSDPKRPNPAVFDIALRGFIGTMKKGFVIDTDPRYQVWNETVFGYQREVSDAGQPTSRDQDHASDTIARKIKVKLKLDMLGESSIEETNRATRDLVSSKSIGGVSVEKYEYELFLNQEDLLVGGKWKSKAPDFAWWTAGPGGDDTYVDEVVCEGNCGNTNINAEELFELARQASSLN